MQRPTTIYVTGFLFALLVGLYTELDFNLAIQRLGDALPEATEQRELLANPSDARDAPVGEKTLSVGYFDNLRINPGVRIVHDPSMGREVLASGPQPMVDALVLNHHNNRFEPDFDRPVFTDRYLEIRLNLSAHGSERLNISLEQPPKWRSSFAPDFRALGELRMAKLSFGGFHGVGPVEINGKEVYLSSSTDPQLFSGRAELLKLGEQKLVERLPEGLRYERMQYLKD